MVGFIEWKLENHYLLYKAVQTTDKLKNVILVLKYLTLKAYLTFESIFHKALNLFLFTSEIMLETVPGTNQY